MSASLFSLPEPLAARMRPRTLEECLGQGHLLGAGRSLGDALRRGDVGSCIFWGPPGTGKTTIARLIARHTDREFVELSGATIRALNRCVNEQGRGFTASISIHVRSQRKRRKA